MEQKVFTREATGLVKEMSTMDAFWMNLYANSPMVAGVFVFSLAPLLFVGGDLVIATLIATLGTAVVGLAYCFSTATMPRSGGDYVFVSRTYHPLIGFFSSFNLSYWVFAFWGFNAFLAATFFSRITGDLGLASVSAYASTTVGSFVVGSAISLLEGLLMITRLRNYLTVQRIIAVYALIIAAAVVAILLLGNGHFPTAFNNYVTSHNLMNSSDPYNTVIQTAANQGFHNPGFTWTATLGVVPVMWGGLLTGWWSTWVSGEMKSARSVKNQMLAIIGSVLVCGLILGAIAFALVSTVGYTFFGSLATSVGSFPGLTASYDFYVRVLSPYVIFIDLGFFLSCLLFIPLDILFTTRSMFAWSFDRLVPAKLSEISDRFHTPVISIIISLIIAEFLIYLFAFTNAVSLYAATTFGVLLTYFITASAVTVFPYVKKDMYDKSPAKRSVGGIPVMTIVGILSMLFLIFMTYYYITVPGLAGLSLITVETVVGLFIVSTVIYFTSRMYHKSKGIDLDMVFKEIPPE